MNVFKKPNPDTQNAKKKDQENKPNLISICAAPDNLVAMYQNGCREKVVAFGHYDNIITGPDGKNQTDVWIESLVMVPEGRLIPAATAHPDFMGVKRH